MKSSFQPHRGRRFSAQGKPAINIKHIAGSVIPREIPRHPCPSFSAHLFQYFPPYGHSFGERGRERFNAVIDPPATAFTRQAMPWGALGRDDRRSSRQRLRNGGGKVLVQCRENEQVRPAI